MHVDGELALVDGLVDLLTELTLELGADRAQRVLVDEQTPRVPRRIECHGFNTVST